MGEKLTDERQKKRLTQAQVCKETGFTPSLLSTYENDEGCNPTIDKLKILAEFYDVSLDYLAGMREGKTLEIESMIKATGLSQKAIETLMHWSYVREDTNPDDEETIDARTAIINFLISHEETVLDVSDDTPIALLSYIHLRIFGKLITPLFRSNDDAEEKIKAYIMALEERLKHGELTEGEYEQEYKGLIFNTLNSNMELEHAPVYPAGKNRVMHRGLLPQRDLIKIYDSDIISRLSHLRTIAEAEADKPNKKRKKGKNGKHN